MMHRSVHKFVLLAALVSLILGSKWAFSEHGPLYGLTVGTCCRRVDVLVVDPQGRKTGADPRSGTIFEKIPNSAYTPDTGIDDNETGQPDPDPGKEIEIMGPQPGRYSIQLVAQAQTRYWLEVRAYEEQTLQEAMQSLTNVSISKGDIHSYSVQYNRDPVPALILTGALMGSGKKKKSIDLLLTYAAPSKRTIILDPGMRTTKLVVVYNTAIIPETFTANLNGANVRSRFHPKANTVEIVEIPLRPGTNVLTLSVNGRTQKEIIKDIDHLTFKVPK